MLLPSVESFEDAAGLGSGTKSKERAFGRTESPFEFMVGDARLERAAFGSGDQRSIHLS